MSSIRSRAPAASSARIRAIMRRIPQVGTAGERVLHKVLKDAGIGFGSNRRPIEGVRIAVDIIVPRVRLCIFVHGCFWHGCKTHFKVPHTNRAWWREKIEDNRRRDRSQGKRLRHCGWHVWRVWEHALTGANQEKTRRRLVSRIIHLHTRLSHIAC